MAPKVNITDTHIELIDPDYYLKFEKSEIGKSIFFDADTGTLTIKDETLGEQIRKQLEE